MDVDIAYMDKDYVSSRKNFSLQFWKNDWNLGFLAYKLTTSLVIKFEIVENYTIILDFFSQIND